MGKRGSERELRIETEAIDFFTMAKAQQVNRTIVKGINQAIILLYDNTPDVLIAF